MSRAAAVVRGNALFSLLFAMGAVLRVIVLVAYQPILMLQRDTYVYLDMALKAQSAPAGFRPPVYPLLFLKPLLVFGRLWIVAAAQHVLALALALLLYAALRRLGARPWVGAVGVAPLLLDAYQLDIEHYLLSEALFQALVVAALLLIVWPAGPSSVASLASGALVGAATLTRFVGAVVIAPLLLYVALRRLGWRVVLLVLTGFAVPLLVYSAWFRSSEGTFGVTDRNGFFLYGRVASFADCAEIQPPRRLRRFCISEAERERAAHLGFWTIPHVAKLVDEPWANRSLLDFSLRAIRAQPLDYLGAVGADFVRFFEPTPPLSQEPYARRWLFPLSVKAARPHPYVLSHEGSAPADTGLESFRIRRGAAEFLQRYQTVVYTRGPLLALLLAIALLGMLARVRHALRRRDQRPEDALFTLSGAWLLLVAVMTTVYHFRYVLPALPLLGPAAAIGLTALIGSRDASNEGIDAARSEFAGPRRL